MYFIVAKGSKHTKEKGSSLESQGEEKTQRKHNFVSTKFAQAQILWQPQSVRCPNVAFSNDWRNIYVGHERLPQRAYIWKIVKPLNQEPP